MISRHPPADYRHWLQRAAKVAENSPHPTVKVGAVLVGPTGEEIGSSPNTFAPGVEPREELLKGAAQSDWIDCAEQLTIAGAAAKGKATAGATLYSTEGLCNHCAGMAAAAKIVCVVVPDQPAHAKFKDKWIKRMEAGSAKLAVSGIKVLKITLD